MDLRDSFPFPLNPPSSGSNAAPTASQIAAQLSARKYQILLAVVECYLENGEPVSSAAVSQKRLGPQAPSAATIRNTMGELAEMGLLTQPHTSAGRLPTATAIQIFVDSLSAIRIQARDVSRLEQQLSGLDSLELRIEEGSHVLTEMTQNVGITASVPPAAQILQQVELVHLSERQYLMVLVTADRLVRNQLVTIAQHLSPSELTEIRNYINFHFSGWTLSKARKELAVRLQEERGQVDELLRKVELFYAKGLLHLGFTPEIYVDGAAYLVGLDLHLTRERMRQLFQALDQKQQILSILDQFLEGTTAQPSVKVGLEEAHPAMGEISLVGMQVPLAGGMAAKVAVLGPLRLNYPRMISAVMQVGKALTQSADPRDSLPPSGDPPARG
jgi:heat-inducible transcriptional repressor